MNIDSTKDYVSAKTKANEADSLYAKLILGLTHPSPQLKSRVKRRRARLLASLCLMLIIFFIIYTPSYAGYGDERQAAALTFLLPLFGTVIVYALSRTSLYMPACTLFLTIYFVWPLIWGATFGRPDYGTALDVSVGWMEVNRAASWLVFPTGCSMFLLDHKGQYASAGVAVVALALMRAVIAVTLTYSNYFMLLFLVILIGISASLTKRDFKALASTNESKKNKEKEAEVGVFTYIKELSPTSPKYWFSLLTHPSAEITDPATRRRARIFSAAVIVWTVILNVFPPILLVDQGLSGEGYFFLFIAPAIPFYISYFMARSFLWEFAPWVAWISVLFGAMYRWLLFDIPSVWPGSFPWLPFSVLCLSLFMPPKQLAVMAFVTFLHLLLPLAAWDATLINTYGLADDFGFFFCVLTASMLYAVARFRDEKQRLDMTAGEAELEPVTTPAPEAETTV